MAWNSITVKISLITAMRWGIYRQKSNQIVGYLAPEISEPSNTTYFDTVHRLLNTPILLMNQTFHIILFP